MTKSTKFKSKIQADPIDFDPVALKAKYLEERDKRLRDEGNSQYQNAAGDFEHYLQDPYAEPLTRDPISDDMEVVIVGGGFGGLLAGARLRQSGVEDIRIIEKGDDFGGTWYWNRYPGAACDVESYIYLPLLEEVGYIPVEKYSRAPEILQHSKNIAKTFGLYKNALFQTEITELRWDEAATRWMVETNRGDTIRARYVILASGPLHRPKLPGIPGIGTFKGHSFHTSRWDYEYTGGDSHGNLTKLKDKTVGIIGTGATAVQCIPYLGKFAKHLYVFQRTPSSIDVRDNRPTDPEWVNSLTPGWQRQRMDNFNILTAGGFADEDLVADGWTDIIRNVLLISRQGGQRPENAVELSQLADFKKMEQIRARVNAMVEDPSTAEALKPWYNQFCKRPCFHDEYLATFNRPNVTLVDTGGKGVERITEDTVIASGEKFEIDCLVYATGFEVGTTFSRRANLEIIGTNGVSLTEKWADGATTLHGTYVNGFPNAFFIGQTQVGLTINFPHMMDEQARHIAYVVKSAKQRQASRVEVTPDAEKEWVGEVVKVAHFREKFLEECTPGYYNNEGNPTSQAVLNGPYGGGPIKFVKLLEAWRAEDKLSGLKLV